MKIIKLILLGLFLSIGILNAQTDFKTGYIINISGDTLYGEIDYRGDVLMSKRCRFRNAEKMITDYSPDDISAFRFAGSKYYVSKEVDYENVFLEYLIQGKVSVLFLGNEAEGQYFLEKEGIGMMKLDYEEVLISRDGKQYLMKSKWHNELLIKYMQDAPEFESRINNIKRPEYGSLVKLAEDYNNAFREEGADIIYEKNRPKLQVNLEVVSGIVNRNDPIPLYIDKTFMQSGILVHFWMPASNEKIYLKTGILYNQFKYDPEKTRGSWNEIDFDKPIPSFKIPIHLEYIYPKGFFRPRLSYGMNISTNVFQTVSADLGANLKLSESLFLSVSSEIEFYGILILPQDYMSYSLTLGVFLKF
jgi:hypothetical protein